MPYILNKTNGTIIATVQDAAIDLSTDLIFVGKNYAGYGEWQNENFLKLLENFANSSAPSKPIDGQLWFNTINKKINVRDNTSWKKLAILDIGDSQDTLENVQPTSGDLWFDSLNNQLKIYDGDQYILIGPPTGSDTRAQWRGDFEFDIRNPNLPVYNIKAVVGSEEDVVAIVSAEGYNMSDYGVVSEVPEYQLYNGVFTKLVRGIILNGAKSYTATFSGGTTLDVVSTRKEVTNLTTTSYFYGTSSESEYALYAGTASYSYGLAYSSNNSNRNFSIPFINTSTLSTGSSAVYIDSGIQYNPATNVLQTIASSALYADIAERYAADAPYEPGTVVVIGGEEEITVTNIRANKSVAGVISTNPAYRMNDAAGSDTTHPYVALAGRVPCKVLGPIKKGDLLVTSIYTGYAEAAIGGDPATAIIGKALESFEGKFGTIQIKV